MQLWLRAAPRPHAQPQPVGRSRGARGFRAGLGPLLAGRSPSPTSPSPGLRGRATARPSGLPSPSPGRWAGAEPAGELLLFQHHRPGLYRALTFFCLGQFTFWAFLAHLAHTSLKGGGSGGKRETETETEGERAKAPRFGLTGNLWRYGFTVSCLTVGFLILGAGSLFCRRSVRRVLLHPGGQRVTLTTYGPLGGLSSFTVPLGTLSCQAHRAQVPALLPIKVRGRAFYFLVDKNGNFPDPHLFDRTVGLYRKL